MQVAAQEGIKSVQLEARIVRADGTVVDLGTIATWHRNPLIRWLRVLCMKLVGV